VIAATNETKPEKAEKAAADGALETSAAALVTVGVAVVVVTVGVAVVVVTGAVLQSAPV